MSDTNWCDMTELELFKMVEELDTRGPRYTSYPTVPVWKAPVSLDAFKKAVRQLGADGKGIAVYVHFPFCRQRCLYCGCNAHITHDQQRMTRYMSALETEIRRISELFAHSVTHSQLHLGGGTPTYIPSDLLARSLDLLIERIPGSRDADRSVEVDPRVTTNTHLQLLSNRGFTRISIGLQDLNPEVQSAVRREFSLDEMTEFVARAREIGFTSINIDLIYGLPRQSRKTWRDTLEAVCHLKPDRLACFGYAHLPTRMKHQQAIKEHELPSTRERLGMLLDAHSVLVDTGYVGIGMDHFALPGDDLAVAQGNGRLWRNFMGYTTTRGLELLGLGCSGISEFNSLFSQNISNPESYAERIQAGELPLERGHELSEDDRATKQIINHLMCNLEIEVPSREEAAGPEFLERVSRAMDQVATFESRGLVRKSGDRFNITRLGQLFVRNLAMPFDRYLNEQSGIVFSKTV